MNRFSRSPNHNLSSLHDVVAGRLGVALQRRLGLRDACAAKGRMGGLTPEA